MSSSSLSDEDFSDFERCIDSFYDSIDMAHITELPPEMQQLHWETWNEHKNDLELRLSASSSPLRKAELHYLLGRLLNVKDGLHEEAAYHLKKAVKLKQPHLSRVLVSLSLCHYKRGELGEAKKMLEKAWKEAGDPTKTILLDLSLVKAKIVLSRDIKDEEKEKLCEEIIQHAEQAHPFDVVLWTGSQYSQYRPHGFELSDYSIDQPTGLGKSHYCAGVGHLISWCLSGFLYGKRLEDSLNAFSEVGQMKRNPKYRYNCALVAKYLGKYELAIHLFRTLVQLPEFNVAAPHIESILNIHYQLNDLYQRYDQMWTSEPPCAQGKNTDTLTYFHSGRNINRTVKGYVKSIIKEVNGLRLSITCLVCDSIGRAFVLLVYGVQPESIQVGYQVTLQGDLLFRKNEVEDWEGKRYSSKTIFVDSLDQLKVVGKPLTDHQKFRKSTISSFPIIMV